MDAVHLIVQRRQPSRLGGIIVLLLPQPGSELSNLRGELLRRRFARVYRGGSWAFPADI
jgi:hypothetical protein